jgi:hypothetical protein
VRAVALAAITACSAGPARYTPPAGPAPRIDHESVVGLPAVSADGRAVVVSETLMDVRGGTALSIRTFAKETTEHVVFTADDSLAASADPTLLAPKVAAGDRWLAEAHAWLDLRPMTVLEETSFTTRASGQVSIEWKANRIAIKNGVTLVDRATPKDWLVETTHTPVADCVAEPRLADAAIDTTRRVAVVRISYRIEADACGDLPGQWHVIRW